MVLGPDEDEEGKRDGFVTQLGVADDEEDDVLVSAPFFQALAQGPSRRPERNLNPSTTPTHTSQSRSCRVRNRGLPDRHGGPVARPFSKAETPRWRNRPPIWPDAPALLESR